MHVTLILLQLIDILLAVFDKLLEPTMENRELIGHIGLFESNLLILIRQASENLGVHLLNLLLIFNKPLHGLLEFRDQRVGLSLQVTVLSKLDVEVFETGFEVFGIWFFLTLLMNLDHLTEHEIGSDVLLEVPVLGLISAVRAHDFFALTLAQLEKALIAHLRVAARKGHGDSELVLQDEVFIA